MRKDAFDLVMAGHFSIDLILSSRIATPKPTLGGPPTYVSLAAGKLGSRVSVVSKVGEDFSDEYLTWLRFNGVDLSGLKRVKGSSTTRFILKYEKEGRQLQLRSRAPPIDPMDIPRFLQAKAVHIAPIANEVSQEVVNELRRSTNTLSLDPQGLVRRFDKEGNVSLKRLADLRILEQINVYKSSRDEIRAVTGLKDLRSAMEEGHEYGPRVVMVTMGNRGAAMLLEGSLYDVPSCKQQAIEDPTGAGDAFIGGFLAEYIRGRDPLWCACVGSAAASFVVEGVGPAVFGGKEEVYARAAEIREP